MEKHTTVDAYIADFPPEAQELISYGMPGYKLNGTGMVCRVQKPHRFLPVYFGCKVFFGKIRPSEIVESRHSVAHSLARHQPLPLDTVAEIVRVRVGENLEKVRTKNK